MVPFNYWTMQSVVISFYLGVCLSVTLLIGDPWQSCVCFIRSGVTCCTLLMVLCLDHMCQCRLHAVLWSHIGTLMHCLVAEPRSMAGLLFPSRCLSGTILQTPYSMVFDWLVSRTGPMLFYLPKLLYPYYSLLLFFSFLFFLSIGWYYWAGVCRLIGCISPSLSLALPTFFNNNNANNTFSASYKILPYYCHYYCILIR